MPVLMGVGLSVFIMCLFLSCLVAPQVQGADAPGEERNCQTWCVSFPPSTALSTGRPSVPGVCLCCGSAQSLLSLGSLKAGVKPLVGSSSAQQNEFPEGISQVHASARRLLFRALLGGTTS